MLQRSVLFRIRSLRLNRGLSAIFDCALELARRRPNACICVALAAFIAAVFWPICTFEFLNYDDNDYVTDNAWFRTGLDWRNIRWAFTTGHASNWHPLTWLSHMVDCQVFGPNPGAHHIVNVFLHVVNTLLVFFVFKKMTGARWRSAFIAALFALHPLHVEPVAWISERKELLCTLFWGLAIWAYAVYAHRGGAGHYLLALVLFALGLMAKPMIVTLPCVLLLLDYWPLRRFQKDRLRALIVEKLPFFLLTAASSIVTFHVQRGRAVVSMENVSVPIRLANAAIAYCHYIAKTVWPSDLAIFYPHPGTWPTARLVGAELSLLGISALVFLHPQRRRYLAVGWLWFLGTLVPVIGIVQVGGQAFADRYSYVSSIGLFIIIAWGSGEIAERLRMSSAAVSGAAAGLIFLIACVTARQLRYWRNSETVFAHALAVTKDNVVANINYGAALVERQRYEDAIPYFSEAARLKPDDVKAEYNIGFALSKLGRNAEAIEHFHATLNRDPTYVPAWTNLGNALVSDGKFDEALASYAHALKVDPVNADSHYSLGVALLAANRSSEAMTELQAAVRLSPSNVKAHNNLGIALTNLERYEEAITEFRETTRLDPDHIAARYNIGSILAGNGRVDEAVIELRYAKAAAERKGDEKFARDIEVRIKACLNRRK